MEPHDGDAVRCFKLLASIREDFLGHMRQLWQHIDHKLITETCHIRYYDSGPRFDDCVSATVPSGRDIDWFLELQWRDERWVLTASVEYYLNGDSESSEIAIARCGSRRGNSRPVDL
jgi:hypothetical protein